MRNIPLFLYFFFAAIAYIFYWDITRQDRKAARRRKQEYKEQDQLRKQIVNYYKNFGKN